MTVQLVPLGEVLQRVARAVKVDASSTYPNVGVLNRSRGVFEKPELSGAETKYKTLYRLAAGDLVYSKLFGWEGAVALIPDWADGACVSGEFPTYSLSSRIDRDYLGHVIAWEGFASQMAASTTGMGQRRQRVNPDQFERILIPLPEPSEQQRIAARLGSMARKSVFTRSTQTGGSILRLIPRVLDRVWASAQLPDTTVGELCQPANDLVRPGQDPSPAREFVGLEFLQPHTGLRMGAGPVTGLSGRKLRFQEGDVLYGYLRPYQNKVWAADRAGLCSVEQYVLRPGPYVDPILLSLALRSSRVLNYAVDQTNSLQLPRLGIRALLAASVPDVRQTPPEVSSRLQSTTSDCVLTASLTERRNVLSASLLPASRNEAFAKLT
jgi:hypothetical protein